MTNAFIQRETDKNLEIIDPEMTIFHPATLVNDIYNLVERHYRKHEGDIEALVKVIERADFESLLRRDKCNSFNVFHNAIHED